MSGQSTCCAFRRLVKAMNSAWYLQSEPGKSERCALQTWASDHDDWLVSSVSWAHAMLTVVNHRWYSCLNKIDIGQPCVRGSVCCLFSNQAINGTFWLSWRRFQFAPCTTNGDGDDISYVEPPFWLFDFRGPWSIRSQHEPPYANVHRNKRTWRSQYRAPGSSCEDRPSPSRSVLRSVELAPQWSSQMRSFPGPWLKTFFNFLSWFCAKTLRLHASLKHIWTYQNEWN